jgi:hypothetical protein
LLLYQVLEIKIVAQKHLENSVVLMLLYTMQWAGASGERW